MAVNKVLIKRDDGFALYSEVEEFEDGGHSEGGRQLTPDDIVDGKAIRDWPTGVFNVKKLSVPS